MKIYEDDKTYAFLDIAKDVDGHTLVIPKKHFESLLECDSETLSDVMNTVQKISNHYVKDCDYEGVNLLNCTKECAGQTVFHFHMHIIPRKSGDGVNGFPSFDGAKSSLEDTLKKLSMS